MTNKEEHLRSIIAGYGSCAVAFSGGIDSALVLKIACEELRDNVLAVTGVSPSLSKGELAHARSVAREFGALHRCIDTPEFSDEQYLANTANRCYHCKVNLYRTLLPVVKAEGFRQIVDGTNADDIRDYRPGTRAARMFEVHSPLMEANLTKADVRALAMKEKIPFWDKPASPCLSSRVPTGTHISIKALAQIDAAEVSLRLHGFPFVRVRYHNDVARIEIPQEQIERLLDPALREDVVRIVKDVGFTFVTLDLQGYRPSGLVHFSHDGLISLV